MGVGGCITFMDVGVCGTMCHKDDDGVVGHTNVIVILYWRSKLCVSLETEMPVSKERKNQNDEFGFQKSQSQ